MTNTPAPITHTADDPRELAASLLTQSLAVELDKKRLSPAAVAAGLGNALTLLRDVMLDQNKRIRELEAGERRARTIVHTLTEIVASTARRLDELGSDCETLRLRMDLDR